MDPRVNARTLAMESYPLHVSLPRLSAAPALGTHTGVVIGQRGSGVSDLSAVGPQQEQCIGTY